MLIKIVLTYLNSFFFVFLFSVSLFLWTKASTCQAQDGCRGDEHWCLAGDLPFATKENERDSKNSGFTDSL